MLPHINKELVMRKYNKTYSSLKSLAEDMQLITLFKKHRIEKFGVEHATIDGIRIDLSD